MTCPKCRGDVSKVATWAGWRLECRDCGHAEKPAPAVPEQIRADYDAAVRLREELSR